MVYGHFFLGVGCNWEKGAGVIAFAFLSHAKSYTLPLSFAHSSLKFY